jgi:hypothetical protein
MIQYLSYTLSPVRYDRERPNPPERRSAGVPAMTSSTAMSRARSGALASAACMAVAVLIPAPALAATPAHPAVALAPTDASGGPGGGDGGGTDGSPSGPQRPFGGGGGSTGGSSSSGDIGDPSGPSDPDDNGTAGGVPHPLPGNHGGGGTTNAASSSSASDSGVVNQVTDLVQNLVRAIASFVSSNNAQASSSGTGADKPSRASDAKSATDEQASGAPKQDTLAGGSSNRDRRANERERHGKPTVDDVVFSVQAGVDRVIGSVVGR